MLSIYCVDKQEKLIQVPNSTKGCWVNVVNPTVEEINRLERDFQLEDTDFLRDALDEEEQDRVEKDENELRIIVEIPICSKDDEGNEEFGTIPLGLIVKDDIMITICAQENEIMNVFTNNQLKNFNPKLKTRFVLQLFQQIASYFLRYLRRINKMSNSIEKELHLALKNSKLLELYTLEKSLVYFSTSLESNHFIMEKFLSQNHLKMYEDDQGLLNDVIIENKQAIRMAQIYSSILGSTINSFASIISNNVNHIVKMLTSVTIIIAIPTMLASIYGMNVKLPFEGHLHAFSMIMITSTVLSIIVGLVFWKKKYF